MTPRRVLASMSLLPLMATLGCDALTVRQFAGTVSQFTIDGVNASTLPPGQHLELWARTQYNDIVQLQGFTALGNTGPAYPGIMFRQAISLDEPCMIDSYQPGADPAKAIGNLLTSPDAYQTSTLGGVTQSPEQQVAQVKNRIAQLTTAGSTGPLIAIVPYSAAVEPSIPSNTSPADRKAACDAYWMSDPNAYIPNPFQITAPLKGYVYGFVKFVSVEPPANYDGFRVDMPLNLHGLQEVFMTIEGPNVDPKNRGPLFMISTMVPGGRDVTTFDLSSPTNGPASGTATFETDLDQDPVMF